MLRDWGAKQEVAPSAQKSQFRSPGLRLIFDKLQANGRTNILDLGPPLTANVGFFSNFNCRVYVGDWVDSLPLNGVEWGSSAAFCTLVSEVLNISESEKFDAILCWDIVNYLNEESLRQLSRFLTQHCNSEALCYMFTSSNREMCSQPSLYRILAEDEIEQEFLTTDVCSSPRYSQGRLAELMPEFKLHRSTLMPVGHQEHILQVR